MSGRVAILLLISAALTTGCANTGEPLPSAESLQRAALSRWQNCLDRELGHPDGLSSLSATKHLMNRCDGHRRDVLLSFPASMERQLDEALRERAQRMALQKSVSNAALWR